MRDTIDMAREVYGAHTEWSGAPLERLESLFALVRADEREACARVCEELDAEYEAVCQMTSVMCGQAIRARGNT
jgi:hypothetical protein